MAMAVSPASRDSDCNCTSEPHAILFHRSNIEFLSQRIGIRRNVIAGKVQCERNEQTIEGEISSRVNVAECIESVLWKSYNAPNCPILSHVVPRDTTKHIFQTMASNAEQYVSKQLPWYCCLPPCCLLPCCLPTCCRRLLTSGGGITLVTACKWAPVLIN